MNKNNKTFNFFKKEGFYLVLFVCICVIATFAAYTVKNNVFRNNKHVAESNTKTKLNKSASSLPKGNANEVAEGRYEDKTRMQNAEMVENNTNKNATTQSNVQSSTAAASTAVTLNFSKPVVGSLILGFGDFAQLDPKDSNTLQRAETIDGLYIRSKIDQEVYAAEGGTVVDNAPSDSKYGEVITIKHANGYKTVYGNLNAVKSVKVGDTVKKGQKIGTIGKTSNHYIKYSDINEGFLYFKMIKNNDPVDPKTCDIKY